MSGMDEAIKRVQTDLPGWMWRVASCSVSDDAWVCPDFNHPKWGPFWTRYFASVEGDPSEYILGCTDVALPPPSNPAEALNKSIDIGLELVWQFSAKQEPAS